MYPKDPDSLRRGLQFYFSFPYTSADQEQFPENVEPKSG